MLSDYTSIINTASCAIKIRALLREADVPKELPIMVKVREQISQTLVEVANMIAGVIDFESSRCFCYVLRLGVHTREPVRSREC